MKKTIYLFFLLVLTSTLGAVEPPAPYGPVPNERQMKYLQSPLAAFIHFGMNTFAGNDGIEWGNDYKRPASTFNPTNGKVDTDQWVRLLKKAGFKRIIITLKHHDGFCTWATKVTDYNISNSPYLDGKGDLAKELSLSCDKYGMDMGVYLSPWDAWEKVYGDITPGDYNDFYDNQLRELLGGEYGRLNPETGKREIVEVWLDGATGAGAAHQTYDFGRFVKTMRDLQPNMLTWMTLGAVKNYQGTVNDFPVDAYWVGNERGYVNDPVWLKVKVDGNAVNQYNPNGQYFSIPEADVSIRPGWFYHKSQDGSVKSLDYLVNQIYYRSVGMGIPLLLNVPPDRAGKIHANDSVVLMQFAKAIQNTYKTNLITPQMSAVANASRGEGYEATNVIDGNTDTYWAMSDSDKKGTITIDLGKDIELDVIKLKEYLPLGQRVSNFKVEVEVFGRWIEFGKGQTIGYQRDIKGKLLPIRKIRLSVDALATPLISAIEAYRTDESITEIGPIPVGIETNEVSNLIPVAAEKVSKLKFEIKRHPAGSWPTLSEMRFYKTEGGKLVEIDRNGITATATSEATKSTNEPHSLATNTLDNNPATIWQPEWLPKVGMPQSLMYDFGKQVEITHISYEPRKTGKDMPEIFNIYLAENATDEYVKTFSEGKFVVDVNKVHFTPVKKNTEWTVMPNYSEIYGDAIRSETDNALLTQSVTGNWFRLMGTKSPNLGILEIWVDGKKIADVDTYNPIEAKDEILYENTELASGTHQVEIKSTVRKNDKSTGTKVILQNILTLSPKSAGMFELTQSFATAKEGDGKFQFEIRRLGDLTKSATVKFTTSPGTGVHGKVYLDKVEEVTFAPGESVKQLFVDIVDNDNTEGNKDFYIEISNPKDAYILGFIKQMRVLVYDNDIDQSNPDIEGYCVPGGTQHSDKKAYLASASTQGAKKNLNYETSISPDNVYVKYIDTPIETRKGDVFTLNLKGFAAGERSSSVVYQDFRYNKAYIFADWDGNLQFSEDEKIAEMGQQPPKDVKLGNYDDVMDITLPVLVPETAVEKDIALRVVYHNAWNGLSNACQDVKEGMVYDFKLQIKSATSSTENVYAPKVILSLDHNKDVHCKGNFKKGTSIELYGLNGNKYYSQTLGKAQQNVLIPTNRLSKGIYVLSIRHDGLSEVYKLVR